MDLIVSFYKLILEASTATYTKKFPWIFGSFIAFLAAIESRTNTDIMNISSFEELFQTISQKSQQELVIVFIVFLALFALNTFGKGNLIVSLSFITNKNHLQNHPTTLRALSKNFISVFLLECIALIFLLTIVCIFSIPILIATGTNPSVVPVLLNFAILTFIPIALIISLIKEFSFLYVLLSPLKIRSAIEAGKILFSRFIARSFFFIFLTILLTGLFTFFTNLIILGLTIFAGKISLVIKEGSISLIVSFVFFAWFVIFLQSLWIAFFKSIARLKTDPVVEEKEMAMGRNIVPEVPPV